MGPADPTIDSVFSFGRDSLLENKDEENYYYNNFDPNYVQQFVVSEDDSTMLLTANIQYPHRIYGYEKPDTNSMIIILFSLYTKDVDGNPYGCRLGSYYQTGSDYPLLKYKGTSKGFVESEVKIIDTLTSVYFEINNVDLSEIALDSLGTED
jgi:hypothetical protein